MLNRNWFKLDIKNPEKYQKDKAIGRIYGLSTGLAGAGVYFFTESIPLALGAIGITFVGVHYFIKRKFQSG